MHDEGATRTHELLERHREGDSTAIGKLIALHYDTIRRAVRREMNGDLRREGDTGDFLHHTLVRVLKSGPKFAASSPMHFHRLIACLVKNELKDGGRRIHAKKRDPAKLERIPTRVSVIDLEMHRSVRKQPACPGACAQAQEQLEVVDIALGLLPSDEKIVLDMRQSGSTFQQIGNALGFTVEGARKKYGRSLRRLRGLLGGLRQKAENPG